ncbi:MAG: ArsR family transcriptional regulator [Deltaproteobacteria bacterium]|nr:MAG: ArsR family transcriptional regulator [Deltaproteobacteria bacterium]
MVTSQEIARVTAMASLLSNTTRARLVAELTRGPKIVGDLAEAVGEAQATVSKQLGILREAGLLCCKSDGRCREYGLTDPQAASAALAILQELGALAEETPRER